MTPEVQITLSRSSPTNPEIDMATPTMIIARVSFAGEMLNNVL